MFVEIGEQGLLFRISGMPTEESLVPGSGVVAHVCVHKDPIPAEMHAFGYLSLGKVDRILDYALLLECTRVVQAGSDYPDERVSQLPSYPS